MGTHLTSLFPFLANCNSLKNIVAHIDALAQILRLSRMQQHFTMPITLFLLLSLSPSLYPTLTFPFTRITHKEIDPYYCSLLWG